MLELTQHAWHQSLSLSLSLSTDEKKNCEGIDHPDAKVVRTKKIEAMLQQHWDEIESISW